MVGKMVLIDYRVLVPESDLVGLGRGPGICISNYSQYGSNVDDKTVLIRNVALH